MSEAAAEEAPSVEVWAASDEEARSLVEDLVAELSDRAFERERVLAKLDIRGAARARRIGRELTLLLRGLAFATDAAGRAELFDSLGQLLEEAHEALEVEGASPPSMRSTPPVSGERPTPPDELPSRELPGNDRAAHTLAADASAVDALAADAMAADAMAADAMAADAIAERPTSHGLPQLWEDDGGVQEETIARKVSWARSGNRILGK